MIVERDRGEDDRPARGRCRGSRHSSLFIAPLGGMFFVDYMILCRVDNRESGMVLVGFERWEDKGEQHAALCLAGLAHFPFRVVIVMLHVPYLPSKKHGRGNLNSPLICGTARRL